MPNDAWVEQMYDAFWIDAGCRSAVFKQIKKSIKTLEN